MAKKKESLTESAIDEAIESINKESALRKKIHEIEIGHVDLYLKYSNLNERIDRIIAAHESCKSLKGI